MAHLNLTELVNFADSFYMGLLGVDVYLKWKKIKNCAKCETEKTFVSWMLDVCEKYLGLPTDEDTTAQSAFSIGDALNSFNFSLCESSDSSVKTIPNGLSGFTGTYEQASPRAESTEGHVHTDSPEDLSHRGDSSIDAFGNCDDAGQIIFIDDDEDEIFGDSPHPPSDKDQSGSTETESEAPILCAEPTVSNLLTATSSVEGNNRDEKLFYCDMCCGNFKTASNLKRHKICSHFNVKQTYKCSHCFATFTTMYDRLEHEEITHGVKVLQCPVCKKKFRSPFSLNQHVKRVHDGKHKHLSCSLCKKKFSYHMTLDSHIKTVHMGIKDHECRTCGKRFGKQYELYYHENSKH